MSKEQLPENLGPNDLAEALLQKLKAGATLDPALKQQLLETLTPEPSTEPKANEDVATAMSELVEALQSVNCKLSLDSIQPRNENETAVLRAVKTIKMLLKKGYEPLSDAEEEERKWFNQEFDMKRPELHRAMIDLLRDYRATIDIDDVNYFFHILHRGEVEHFKLSLGSTHLSGVPKGFSEGELLEIRRRLIQRYLDEIPEDKDDPYNSSRLWYLYLIRPDVFCYERGEDVQFLIGGAIDGYGSQEAARPDRAAYVRGILQDTLANLDNEKAVVTKLDELSKQYPSAEYTIQFVRGDNGRGNIVVNQRQTNKPDKVVETLMPEKPMIAADFNVIR